MKKYDIPEIELVLTVDNDVLTTSGPVSVKDDVLFDARNLLN